MLKVGFIGAGGRAQDAHYPTVYRMDGVSVQAVCELDTISCKKYRTNIIFLVLFQTIGPC